MKIEYHICESFSAIELKRDVEQLLNDGWECLGGVAVGKALEVLPMISVERLLYCQALIRKNKED